MSADDLEVAFELVPPASPKAGFLGNIWNTMSTCKTYEIFPSLEMCALRHQETSQLFEDTLFIVFILLIFAFLISSIYTIFVEERKYFKDICNKVRKSTDALNTMLAPLWSLKEIKVNKLRLEVGCEKVNKVKIPTYMLDGKKFEVAAIAFADLNSLIKISKPVIFYTHEEDLPIESDWIFASRTPSEITGLIISEQLLFKNLRKEQSGPTLRLPDITEVSDEVSEKKIVRERVDTAATVELSSKTDFSSKTVEAIPEAHSDAENTSSTKKWKKKLLPLPKEYKSRKENLEQDNFPNNNVKSAKSGGIFSERKKSYEKVKLTKNMEQNVNARSENSKLRSNKISTINSRTPNVAPKKSGIFNKSKPQPRLEALNKQKNI